MEDFKWTDELVKEYLSQFISPLQIIGNTPIMQTKIEAFKKSKEPKKEYEIISFKHKNELYNLTNDGNYGRRNFINPASLNHVPEKSEIISVRRLSDGEVFTVGDRVMWGKPCNIIRLFISSNGLMWCDLKYTNGNEYQNANIGCLDKVKEVLFTTEDGVPIYERDTFPVYKVDFAFNILQFAACDACGNSISGKYFSTKEAAEDWILMNKPILSLNDLIIVWDGDRLVGLSEHYKSSPMFQRFKELAKLKL